MKVYKGTFKKVNGQIREMMFAHLEDLPMEFLDSNITGSGEKKTYKEGMELVWDLENEGFRVFNWETQIGPIEVVENYES